MNIVGNDTVKNRVILKKNLERVKLTPLVVNLILKISNEGINVSNK